jgi:hypothetical protein
MEGKMRYWILCATLASMFLLAGTSAAAGEKIWDGDANLKKGMLKGKVLVLTCHAMAEDDTSFQSFSNCCARSAEHASEVEDLTATPRLSGEALARFQDGFRLGVNYYVWSALTTITEDARKSGSPVSGQLEGDMQSFYRKFRALQLKYDMPDSGLLDIMISAEDRPAAVLELENARKKAQNK